MPKNTAPASSSPAIKRAVRFRLPYGDFPGYKTGDVELNPTDDMITKAKTSNCLELFWADETGNPTDPPATES